MRVPAAPFRMRPAYVVTALPPTVRVALPRTPFSTTGGPATGLVTSDPMVTLLPLSWSRPELDAPNATGMLVIPSAVGDPRRRVPELTDQPPI